MNSRQRHAEIAGAGFAGLAAAAALAQRGWSVRVHEKGDRLRTAGAGIFIYENGLKVFEALGVYETVTNGAFQGRAREMRDDDNNTIARIEWPQGGPLRMFTILRQKCIDALAQAAREAGAEIVTSSEVVGASPEGELVLADGTRLAADLVVGADGVGSATRDSLLMVKSWKDLPDGAVRVLIPRTEDERTRADRQVYVEYWSGVRRILYAPCSDDWVYLAMMMLNADEDAKRIPVDVAAWSRSFPYLDDLFARIGEHARWDPFVVIRLKSWSAGRVAVIGDAAHPMAPNLGQGGGCGMMNALSLAVYLERHDDVTAALAEWERRERPLTEHTQRWSTIYGWPTKWPPAIKARAYQLAHRWPWMERQRLRTASHVPTGWPGPPQAGIERRRQTPVRS
jgi:2-polyprenyl-6-methoxyphenol hydroxylase-like FAD-dependent oxidoreductase